MTWAKTGGQVYLELDLQFSRNACCQLNVWVNDLSKGPVGTLPIHAGQRWFYAVAVYESQISRLRLDPGSVAGSSVVVRRIWIARGSRSLDELSPSVIRRYPAARAASRPVHGGVEFLAQRPDPTLDSPVSLATHTSALRLFLQNVAGKPLDYFTALLLVGAVLTLPLALISRQQAWFVLALLGVCVLVRGLPPLLSHWQVPDDVTESVGYSVYTGLPKRHEQLMLILTALAAVAVPALLVAALRLVRRPARAGPLAATSAGLVSPRMLAVPIAVVLLLAVFFAPDLKQTLSAARTAQYLPQWDTNNLLFWDYLVHKGLVPVKDFFYPYGFQYLFTIAAPWGTVIGYLSYMAFWTYLVVGTFLALAGFFAGRALLTRFGFVTAVVVSAVLAGYLPLASRYVGALGVVLLFAAIDHVRGGQWRTRVLFALAFAHVALFEPAQAVYTLPALAFLFIADLLRLHATARRDIIRRLATALATIAAPALAVVVVFAATGQLGGTVDFYSQVPAETIGWAAPSLIAMWIGHPSDLSGFIYWAVPVSIALGIYGVLTKRREVRSGHALVVALGLLGFMMMQKQVVRQGIQSAIWLPAVYGLLLWLVIETTLARGRQRAAAAAILGALAGLVLVTAGYEHGVRTLIGGPRRVVRSAAALANDRSAFAAVDRTRFSVERFQAFTQDRQVVAALRNEPAVREGKTIWILGDDSPITIMLGRRSPYYFTTYFELSPIDWQRKLVRQLERKQPALAVWNSQASAFDGVPDTVRDPLLFDWAIQHLRAKRTVGTFELLRPRRGKPVDLAWWRSRLGEAVDLEHLPQYTHVSGARCASGPDCRSYVVVEFAKGAPVPSSESVFFTVAGLQFRGVFAGAPGVRRYVLDLNRLWFWHNAPASARNVNLNSVGGAMMTLERRRSSKGILY